MSTKYYIGTITIHETIEETNRRYETASWWKSYRVKPGTYKVFGFRYCDTGKYIWQPAWDANGEITGEYFGSPYDGENVGKSERAPFSCPGTLADAVERGDLELAPWAYVDGVPAMRADGTRYKGRKAIFLQDSAPWFSRTDAYGTKHNEKHPAI